MAYQRALQERGFDKLSKEDNHRRSEAANINRQLKDTNLSPADRERLYNELDKTMKESYLIIGPKFPVQNIQVHQARWVGKLGISALLLK